MIADKTISKQRIYTVINLLIAAVWIANGLFCKVLNLVPRHEQIVARILGNAHSRLLTVLIGLSEITMAIWIASKWQSRLNAITQIIVIAVMNTIEFFLAQDLLLWGKMNAVFALLLIAVIYYNEFVLHSKPNK